MALFTEIAINLNLRQPGWIYKRNSNRLAACCTTLARCCFALFLIIGLSAVIQASENVRIGVFWLFDIRTINISPVDNTVSVIGNNQKQNVELTFGHKLI